MQKLQNEQVRCANLPAPLGIETSFRDPKHTIGIANFHSKSPEYIEHVIVCRMILYNFCETIAMEVTPEKKEKKWEYQVNLSMAIKICFAFLQDPVAPRKCERPD